MSDRIQFKLMGFDAFTRIVKKIGNGAYVPIPSKYLGKRVKVILMEE